MGFGTNISAAMKGNNNIGVLYLMGLSFIAADIVPTPADALYFYLERKNKEKLETGKITPKQYWIRSTVSYYTLNPAYWALVLGAIVLTKGNFTRKAQVGIAILAGGAVLGVIAKNIQKDEERYTKESLQKN